MQKSHKKKDIRPPQHQNRQPGIEAKMKPLPVAEKDIVSASGRLLGKVALITGGDSGIGRAVALAFAAEGADVVISYLDEDVDALATAKQIESYGRRALLIAGDIGREKHCEKIVRKAVKQFGKIDILVNNAAVQYPQKSIKDITAEQLLKTFTVNIFAQFYFVKAVLPHMSRGSSIINTTSVTAYRGSGHLVDYSSTKGAIVGFTRSLSSMLADKGIRVNGGGTGADMDAFDTCYFPCS